MQYPCTDFFCPNLGLAALCINNMLIILTEGSYIMKPFRTKSGKWKAKFSWYDTHKQRHYTSKTFVSKVDAENWLTVKKMDKMQGKTAKATTFLWVFDHYFDTYKK